MTPAQEKRHVRAMSTVANEPVAVDETPTTYYVFGSELACLRIFALYNSNGAHWNKNARVGYSEPRASWYFSLNKPAYTTN